MPARKAVTIEKNDFFQVAADVRAAFANEARAVTLDLLHKAVELAPVEFGDLRGTATAHFNGELIGTGADRGSAFTWSPSAGRFRAPGGQFVSGAHVRKSLDRPAKGAVNAPTAGPGSVGNQLGLVQFNEEYAAAQHERTDYHHPRGGQAKYLETAIAQNRAAYQKRLANAVMREIGG